MDAGRSRLFWPRPEFERLLGLLQLLHIAPAARPRGGSQKRTAFRKAPALSVPRWGKYTTDDLNFVAITTIAPKLTTVGGLSYVLRNMPITKETVDHVAKLARLEFPEEKKAKFTEQLGNILDYVSKLNELKTDDVAPLTHTLELDTPYREDAVKPSLGLEDALSNAPAKEGPYFKVPPIIEEPS